MFVSNKIQKLEHHDWSYCFCADYENRRKCELCITVNDFDYFEELMRGKKLDRDFVSHYHQKLLPYLRQLFFAKKKSICFLNNVYTHSIRKFLHNEPRTFHVEDIADELLNRKLNEKKGRIS